VADWKPSRLDSYDRLYHMTEKESTRTVPADSPLTREREIGGNKALSQQAGQGLHNMWKGSTPHAGEEP